MSTWTLTDWPVATPLAALPQTAPAPNRWARYPTVPIAPAQAETARDNTAAPEVLPAAEQPQSRPVVLHDKEIKLWSARLTQAVLEVLEGGRPCTQLVRWVSPAVYASLDQRVRRSRRDSKPTAPSALVRRRASPAVLSTHVCQPVAGVAEVSVHVRGGGRSRAIAIRLERQRDRWLCTAFTIL